MSERVYPNKYGRLRLPTGSYGRDLRGRWWLRPLHSDSAALRDADVFEHQDGTITVSGHLINGQWRTA